MLEENEKLVLTPFEKNLDICRQLWRVLERSDLIVMVVDARDTLFYRCPDLEGLGRNGQNISASTTSSSSSGQPWPLQLSSKGKS
ncbi:GTPase LSG1-1-like [Brassica napus]|uniref:GTPase LSG1-1-like n=1 Tax=Brassica napus TaxID=3708 RepID=UPI0006AB27A3|nr:GTPase LSG1-1-like [Brassica napus]